MWNLLTPGKLKIAINVLVLVSSIIYERNAHKYKDSN